MIFMETSYQMECECGFKTSLYDQRGNAETAWIVHRRGMLKHNPVNHVPHAGGTLHQKRNVNFSWKESDSLGFPEGIAYENGFLK